MSVKAHRIVGMVVGGIALAVVLAFLLGFVVQALWNWLMPGIFGLPEITYWQAWGMLVLAHLLLGGGPRIHHGKDHCRDEGKSKFLVKIHEHFVGPHGEEGGGAEPARP